MMRLRFLLPLLAFAFLFTGIPAQRRDHAPKPAYKTQNAVIIIMDGARYSETWGDSTHANIPHIYQEIAPAGTVNTGFYNDGPTYTLAGHSALATGYYAEINNSGKEFPAHPSIFQAFNKQYPSGESLSWVVASKDKISILSDCSDTAWQHKWRPDFDCGKNGKGTGSGYRNDSLTCLKASEILKTKHPRLMLINFEEPDGSGHSGKWEDYRAAIKKTDAYIDQIWDLLQTEKFYKNHTAIFITNDHGRHLNNVEEGFKNHGCSCDGCRHVFFIATGPDFRKHAVINHHYDLVDIPATIATLLGVPFSSEGETMKEILK